MTESASLSALAALASPLPPAPEGEIFTHEQWATLLAICEVFIPSISSSSNNTNSTTQIKKDSKCLSLADGVAVSSQLQSYLPETADDDLVKTFLAESVTTLPGFKDAVHRTFSQYAPSDGVQGLKFVLSTLNTRIGALLLTGSMTPLHERDLATRSIIVAAWQQSYFKPLRAVQRSLFGLSMQKWLQLSPSIPRLLDFPSVPKHIERNPSFQFEFLDFTDPSKQTELTFDVVIIGSGCGAGVLASHLSRAGLKCLVVEKSYHFPSTHFPMNVSEAGVHLMENGGVVLADDLSIGISAGSTWGGGGTVNWSASLQPKHFVREEWSKVHGLPHFTTAEFQDCLDTVCSRMGVAKPHDHSALSNIEQNFANATLIEGARRLGLAAEIVPQNTASKHHLCGSCSTGCASATKQGPANCWLPDAAQHGAQFIEGCFVDKILFSATAPTTATGVAATWTSRSRSITRALTIKASRVIVSAGSLQSPLLLTRSGLTNRHIGNNLHLHPVAAVQATWPHRVAPWEGAILTSAVTSAENHDGQHHGPKIEVLCSTPGVANLFVPWRGTLTSKSNPAAAAINLKLAVAQCAFSTYFFGLQRDRDSGRVYADAHDPHMVHIAYTPSSRDREGLLAGQILAARIAYVMGALEIDTLHPLLTRFTRSLTATDATTTNDAAFEIWLAAVQRQGLTGGPEVCPTFASAHQMGTCRMSSHQDSGVVDPAGKVWGLTNVYVGDASVFPSASGVNPMVTNMGIAEWIARGIVREVKG